MLLKLGYLTLLGLIVILEHVFFGHYSELIRRGMGIVTVMVLTLILVWLSAFHSIFDCWFWIFLGFCEAGAILILMTHAKQQHTRQMAINELEILRHGENIKP